MFFDPTDAQCPDFGAYARTRAYVIFLDRSSLPSQGSIVRHDSLAIALVRFSTSGDLLAVVWLQPLFLMTATFSFGVVGGCGLAHVATLFIEMTTYSTHLDARTINTGVPGRPSRRLADARRI